jgi:hypothetical protein
MTEVRTDEIVTDCESLTGRMRQICRGESGLAPKIEVAYRRLWAGMAPPNDLSCVHRGEHIDWAECASCPKQDGKSKTRLKIFACAIHGRCLMAHSIDGVRGCSGCEDKTQ